jgi:hypothetical protein
LIAPSAPLLQGKVSVYVVVPFTFRSWYGREGRQYIGSI